MRLRLPLLLVLLVGLPGAAAEPSKLVQLEAVGTASDVDALQLSLEDWLRPLQLELRRVPSLRPVDEAPSFARVRVVWTDEACVVEVFRGTGELMRKKSLPRGGPALLVSESAALIAHAGVQELSIEEAKRQPLPTPPVVAAEVKQPEPEAPSSPVDVSLAAYVQGRSYDRKAPFVFGGGAELRVGAARGTWRPSASLLVSYQGPVSRSSELVRVQVQAVSFRLLPSLKRELGPFELQAGAGGGLDVLIAASDSTRVPEQFVQSRTDAAPFLSAALGVMWRPSPSSGVFLRGLVDFDPARRRYLTTVAGQSQTVLEPWGVRPSVQLGFSFDLVSGRTP